MRWQRRARFVVAVLGVVFAVFVALQFRRRQPPAPPPAIARTDLSAAVETTGGETRRFTSSREDVSVQYEKLLSYGDGSSTLHGVTIVSKDRTQNNRSFTVTAKEARITDKESNIRLDGDVELTSSDGTKARTQRATYAQSDSTVNATGPVEFSRGRLSGTGVGMRYENTTDTLLLLDQAVVRTAPDEQGAGAADVTSGSAAFARRDNLIRFERSVRMVQRSGQTIEADAAIAYLSSDQERVERIELHSHAHITGSAGAAGSLQDLAGDDMNLTYAADGQSLQHAVLSGSAAIRLAGEAGSAGRQIEAKMLDVLMAPDGSTPIGLTGREAVQLTFPAEADRPARTIRSANLDAKGEPGRGLTRAVFTGSVQFRERGTDLDRGASSGTLDVALQPGMAAIDEAVFTHRVIFEDGDRMTAWAATGRYDLNGGTLDLSGTEPAALVPRVVNGQMSVDAAHIVVTLKGPVLNADGAAKSTVQPEKSTRSGATDGAQARDRKAVKMPSMLKADKPVTVVADGLAYDGDTSAATYTGGARLFQGDTTIKADEITIDEDHGDLTATGHVMTTSIREQTGKDKKPERMQSTGTSDRLKYEESARRLTYTGAAHIVGPEGDMSAAKIELYLKPSGDDLDRAEAYGEGGEKLTLREQNRTTTGLRMTYTADRETYVVTGLPATVVDECARETTGKTLTFVKATDTIVVDGNQQIRTQTKGGTGGKCQ